MPAKTADTAAIIIFSHFIVQGAKAEYSQNDSGLQYEYYYF
jgi:hypothetical protein